MALSTVFSMTRIGLVQPHSAWISCQKQAQLA
jgi:hypothetical protein